MCSLTQVCYILHGIQSCNKPRDYFKFIVFCNSVNLNNDWRVPKEVPSTWHTFQYQFPSCQMSSLKEAAVFLHWSQKRTEFDTNIWHQIPLRSWKSIKGQTFASKNETKLLIHEPIKLRNANSSNSKDEICMEAQMPCNPQPTPGSWFSLIHTSKREGEAQQALNPHSIDSRKYKSWESKCQKFLHMRYSCNHKLRCYTAVNKKISWILLGGNRVTCCPQGDKQRYPVHEWRRNNYRY